jgi:hypothetical protein
MIERPRLAPCPRCQRHLRVDERGCPFCGAAIATGSLVSRAPTRPAVSPQTLGRAAIFAFGSAIASSAPGCYLVHERTERVVERPVADAWEEEDGGSIGFLYGSPPEPDGRDAGGTADAGVDEADTDAAIDEGAPITLYGGPMPVPLDAGAQEEDAGGDMPVYGGPPEP